MPQVHFHHHFAMIQGPLRAPIEKGLVASLAHRPDDEEWHVTHYLSLDRRVATVRMLLGEDWVYQGWFLRIGPGNDPSRVARIVCEWSLGHLERAGLGLSGRPPARRRPWSRVRVAS